MNESEPTRTMKQRAKKRRTVLPHRAPVFRIHSRAFSLPPLDASLIRWVPPLLILGVVVAVLVDPAGAAAAIGTARTFITEYFTWYFVLYSVITVLLCIWVAFSRHGTIRLGGPKATKQHSNFAWYSMLFACGQGIGLIFWSVAEPIMLTGDTRVVPLEDGRSTDGALAWSYFHWGLTAWAMYCAVALCLAYSHHNLGKTLTFREAIVDMFPLRTRRPLGVVVELLAIMATVLGLATSFGFATLQFSSGVVAAFGGTSGMGMWLTVVLCLAALASLSVFFGVEKGMKRISELNSVLSIALVIAVFALGPTVYLLSTLLQSTGVFIQNFPLMSFWTDSFTAGQGIDSWQDSWNGWWTVFIWAWVIAFSPFVAGFIARISRGRTLREFVVGVTLIPSVIVVIWIAIIGGAAQYFDQQSGGQITDVVSEDTSAGLFRMLAELPGFTAPLLIIVATVLVATYYVTSLDSGVHALSEFVSAPKSSSPLFRVVLVLSIATVAIVLLTIGGAAVMDTVQTGTILGAFPFALIIMLMMANLVRRLNMLKPVRVSRRLPSDMTLDSSEDTEGNDEEPTSTDPPSAGTDD